jgi:hypothetical protein
MANLHIKERLKTIYRVLRHGGFLTVPLANLDFSVDPRETEVIAVTHNGGSYQIVLPMQIVSSENLKMPGHLRRRKDEPEKFECVVKINPYVENGEVCFMILSQKPQGGKS